MRKFIEKHLNQIKKSDTIEHIAYIVNFIYKVLEKRGHKRFHIKNEIDRVIRAKISKLCDDLKGDLAEDS